MNFYIKIFIQTIHIVLFISIEYEIPFYILLSNKRAQ